MAKRLCSGDHQSDPKRSRLEEQESFPTNITVQAFDWGTYTLQGTGPQKRSPLVIRCWCKNQKGELQLLVFKGFVYTVYVELPDKSEDGRSLAWNSVQVKSLLNHLKYSPQMGDCRPLATNLVMKNKLYYAESRPKKFVRARFTCDKEVKQFCRVTREGFTLDHIGNVCFPVHEDNVKVLTKFLARTEIKCTQWFSVNVKEVTRRSCKLTSSPSIREFEADFESVRPVESEKFVSYKVMSFDLEVYSSVGNRFPRAIVPADEIFAVSVVTETFYPDGEVGGEGKRTRKRWCICRGRPMSYAEMVNQELVEESVSSVDSRMPYETINCDSEAELIDKFVGLIQSEDPDVVTGHNIWNFDMRYLFIRSKLILKRPLPNMGRTSGVTHTELTSTANTSPYSQTMSNVKFLSNDLEQDGNLDLLHADGIGLEGGAYGETSRGGCRKLTVVNGVLTLQPVERGSSDRALESLYKPSVQTPAHQEYRHKRGSAYMRNKIHSLMMEGRVSIDTMKECEERKFEIYSLQHVCQALMGKSKMDVTPDEMFRAYRLGVSNKPTDEDIMSLVESLGEEKASTPEALKREGERQLGLVAYYCVKDSELVMDLFDHLSAWPTRMEYSKCFGVTPYESLACGQQARCLSIVYAIASKRGLVLDHPDTLDHSSAFLAGGRVVSPLAGLYDYVLCLDFNSLYPSIIREMNICHTTFIPKERWGDFSDPSDYHSIREEGGLEFRFSRRKLGIIPELCKNLVLERQKAKAAMNEASEGSALKVTMDCRQKALKITANSLYGLMGAEMGALKLLEGSSSITCRGRQLQMALAKTLEENFGVMEVYGDTDSSMVTGKRNLFPDSPDGTLISSAEQAHELGRRMEEHLNGKQGSEGLFGNPIRVEMEKVMKMLSVQKKMYAYLEYARIPPEAGGASKYILDARGDMAITSKGLLTARRDTCKACKEAFNEVLRLVLTDVAPKRLLLEVADLVKKILTEAPNEDFHKTVEIAGQYAAAGCANNVFKNNMFKLGTKIEPRSRVKYVIVITDREVSGGRCNTGEKMLLLKYFDQNVNKIDRVYYLRKYLMNSMDRIVSLAAPSFDKLLHLPGLGKVRLNHPVEAIVMLIESKNACWDMGGLDCYRSLVTKASGRLRVSADLPAETSPTEGLPS